MLIFDDIEVEEIPTRYGRMLVPKKDSVIGRSLRLYGEWAEHEISMVSTLLKDGDVILDVGANIGTHALALASRFPCSPVFAFEPQPLAAMLLSANICLSSKPNCKPMPMACGRLAAIGDVDPTYDDLDWNIGAVSLRDAFLGADQTTQQDNFAYPTLVVPLDACRFPGRVQLIKIDVEGMEDDVIAGAIGLIERDRPVICFEVLALETMHRCRELLLARGYELRWLETNAFNDQNFNGNVQNVWALGETSILALPVIDDFRVRFLKRVSGNETDIPRSAYAR